MKLKSLLICLLAFSLTACILEDESSDQTFLEGSWADTCADYDEQSRVFGYPVVTYSGDKVTVIANTYSDSDCQTLRSAGRFEGTVEIGSNVILPESGLEVTQLLTTYTLYTLTPLNQDAVDAYNADEFCGFTDWAMNSSKDLLSCFLGDVGGNPVKQIVLLDGNTLDFGDTEYLSADGFPTRLQGSPSTRQ